MRPLSRTESASNFDPRSNRILAQLPENELERLLPFFECQDLEARHVLVHPNIPIRSVYFPLDSIASLVNKDADGHKLEVGLTGMDGMVGYPLLLGVEALPQEIFIQIPGLTLKMDAEVFVAACNRNEQLRMSVLRFSQAMYNQVTQVALCNNSHTMEERLCRWLLMCRDRLESDQIPPPRSSSPSCSAFAAPPSPWWRGCFTKPDSSTIREAASLSWTGKGLKTAPASATASSATT